MKYFINYSENYTTITKQTNIIMISLYSDAVLAWQDYINNGFASVSKGIFFADFVDFLKKNHLNEFTKCFIDFYEDNFPTLTILQSQQHFKGLVKNQQIEFFDRTSINIQKNFINFCYTSIENLHFPSSHWIMLDDEFQTANQNSQVIDLTEETDDDMPPLINDNEINPVVNPVITDNTEHQIYMESIINYFNNINTSTPIISENGSTGGTVKPPDDDIDLYHEALAELEQDSSDDEMPELEEVEHNQPYTNLNTITV